MNRKNSIPSTTNFNLACRSCSSTRVFSCAAPNKTPGENSYNTGNFGFADRDFEKTYDIRLAHLVKEGRELAVGPRWGIPKDAAEDLGDDSDIEYDNIAEYTKRRIWGLIGMWSRGRHADNNSPMGDDDEQGLG